MPELDDTADRENPQSQGEPTQGRLSSEQELALVEMVGRETRRRRDDWIAQRILRLTPEQRQTLAAATEIMKELANS